MKRTFLAVSGLFLVISLAGCYTLLQHPEISAIDQSDLSEELADGAEAEVGYDNDCLACHGDGYEAFAYSDGYYGFSHAPYAYTSSAWQYYYGYPWWVDNSEAAYEADVTRDRKRSYGARSRRKNPSDSGGDIFIPTSSGGGGASTSGSVGSSSGGAAGSNGSASGSSNGNADGGKYQQRTSGTRTKNDGSDKQDRPVKEKKSDNADEKDDE